VPARLAFYDSVRRNVANLPGVDSVDFASNMPFTSIGNTNGYEVESQPRERDADALYRAGTATYLTTIGARLREGRLLDERDHADAPNTCVVNETFARRHFRGSGVGKRVRFTFQNSPWMTIAGVVHDLNERGLEMEPKPAIYVPYAQVRGGGASFLLVRTKVDPYSVASAVREVIWSVDREQPIYRLRTMEEVLDLQVAGRRQQMRLLAAFSALALLLAAIGIYGVLSYTVSQRTREIGLRMALGAGRGDVMAMVLRRGFVLVGCGVLIGAIAALALARLIESFLFGVKATDWPAYAAAGVTLLIAALAACFVPARRASSVDPMTALREE